MKLVYIFCFAFNLIASENQEGLKYEVWPFKSTNVTLFLGLNQSGSLSCFLNKKKLRFFAISEEPSRFNCEIPPISHFTNKTQLLKVFINNSVLLMTQIIHYLHVPVIHSFFPHYIPDSGGMIYVRGKYFSKLPENIFLRLNKKWSFNCTVLQSDLLACFISGNPKKNLKIYKVSLLVNNHTLSLYKKGNLSFYGLKAIWPKKGPVEKSTKILVKGFGFHGKINAYCKISDYIVNATIKNESYLYCNSKVSNLESKEKYNHFLPFSIMIFDLLEENLTNAYTYDINSLWTKNAVTFYVYVSPNATSIDPSRILINELMDLYIYSSNEWSFKNALLGDADLPKKVISQYFGDKIYCKFGDFGKTKATYLHENLIKCSTPPIKTDLSLIYEVEKTLSLTFNNKTYITNRGITVTFVGVTSPLLYTWIFVSIFLGISMFSGLVVYILKYKRKRPKIQ